MRSLSLEKKIILTAALFAACITVLVAVLVYPLIRSIQTMHHDTQALKENLERRYADSLGLRATLRRLAEVKSELSAHPNYLFLPGQELELITAIEKTAGVVGVTALIEQSNLDTPARAYNRLSITATGAYANIIQYLAQLEALPYFVNLERVSLSPQIIGREQQPDLVQADITLSIYVSK